MAGNREGARKAREKNLAKDPDFYRNIGGQSWKNPERSHKTGFALLDEEKHLELSQRGGKKTKNEYRKVEKAPETTTSS